MREAACGLLAAVALSAPASAVTLNTRPVTLHPDYPTGASFMGVRLLGVLELPTIEVDGLPLVELSALAWDQDEDRLYAISDNGYLFHLRPRIADGRLVGVTALAGYRLRDQNDKPFKPKFADAEGLLLLNGNDGVPGNSELRVSFERRPRVLRMSTDGRQLGTIDIAAKLRSRSSYISENKALEGIALHPRWGLLGAGEWPLKGEPTADYSLFALERGEQGWRYPRFPAPKAGLVAMEVLEDGGLLTLERAYVSLWQPMYIILRRTAPLPAPGNDDELAGEVVAEFSTHNGWVIDNFEGLTRHRGRRFFMISDDNRKSLQRTLLVYFELLE